MSKRIIIFIFIAGISCKQNDAVKKNFGREDIIIPNYYTNYDYRKFWEAKGFDFTFANHKPDGNRFKDSTSTNFFNLYFSFANSMCFSKNERIDFLNKEMELKPFEINDRYEIYKNESIDTFPITKGLHSYLFKFISLKDSVDITVSYQTFDQNEKKLNDYNLIVKQITEELKIGNHFKTIEKKPARERYIVN